MRHLLAHKQPPAHPQKLVAWSCQTPLLKLRPAVGGMVTAAGCLPGQSSWRTSFLGSSSGFCQLAVHSRCRQCHQDQHEAEHAGGSAGASGQAGTAQTAAGKSLAASCHLRWQKVSPARPSAQDREQASAVCSNLVLPTFSSAGPLLQLQGATS